MSNLLARSVCLLFLFWGIVAVSADDQYQIQAVDVHGQTVIVVLRTLWMWRLKRKPKATVVCFVGTECPLVRLYASRTFRDGR